MCTVQRSLVSWINESRLSNLNYWQKLKALRLYSQERRRDRYMVIFLWKISQGMVSGYTIPFTSRLSRTGTKVVPAPVVQSTPAAVKRARSGSLAVKGAQLFNLLPANLRNSKHGVILMFKPSGYLFREYPR